MSHNAPVQRSSPARGRGKNNFRLPVIPSSPRETRMKILNPEESYPVVGGNMLPELERNFGAARHTRSSRSLRSNSRGANSGENEAPENKTARHSTTKRVVGSSSSAQDEVQGIASVRRRAMWKRKAGVGSSRMQRKLVTMQGDTSEAEEGGSQSDTCTEEDAEESGGALMPRLVAFANREGKIFTPESSSRAAESPKTVPPTSETPDLSTFKPRKPSSSTGGSPRRVTVQVDGDVPDYSSSSTTTERLDLAKRLVALLERTEEEALTEAEQADLSILKAQIDIVLSPARPSPVSKTTTAPPSPSHSASTTSSSGSRVEQLVAILDTFNGQDPSEDEKSELKTLQSRIEEQLFLLRSYILGRNTSGSSIAGSGRGGGVTPTHTAGSSGTGSLRGVPMQASMSTSTPSAPPSQHPSGVLRTKGGDHQHHQGNQLLKIKSIRFFDGSTAKSSPTLPSLNNTANSKYQSASMSPGTTGVWSPLLNNNPNGYDDANRDGLDENESATTVGSRQGGGSFISALALQSFQLNSKEEPFCTPVTVACALLFVDISGYSKVSKLLESKGAFALFSAVNCYMMKLIDIIVTEYHGQVVKFCGDAMMVVWYGQGLPYSALVEQAYHCSMALLERCGESHVDGLNILDEYSYSFHSTDDYGELSVTGKPTGKEPTTFGIHVGLTHGEITSRVMRSATVRNMESNFHLVEGKPVVEMGAVLETAARGCLCVSRATSKLLPAAVKLVETPKLNVLKVMNSTERSAQSTPPSAFGVSDKTEDLHHMSQHYKRFIHPTLVELSQRGITQTSMAKMRQLAVMFVLKTDDDNDENGECSEVDDWFAEVQDIMDEHRCSIIQVIHDDKGLHVVAAANLHLPDRTPAVTAIRVAVALKARSVDCAMGVACGVTFCGVIGGPQASRYDITGEPCVRACRLMQFAESRGESIALDESVVAKANDLSLTVPMPGCEQVDIKGCEDPIEVFTVAKVDTLILSSIISGTRYCPRVHENLCKEIRSNVVERGAQRAAALVRGGIGTGKVVVCVRAVYSAGVVPVLHRTVENSPPLDIVRTIGQWFKSHANPQLAQLAERALHAQGQNHNLLAIRRALELVTTTIKLGLRTALIVQQCQKLDPLSVSFLRQAMNPSGGSLPGKGRWLVFATFVPQYGTMSSATMSASLGPCTFQVEAEGLSVQETEALSNFVLGWRISASMLVTIAHMSRRVVELVVESAKQFQQHRAVSLGATVRSGGAVVTMTGEIACSEETMRSVSMRPWGSIAPAVTSKLSQIVDALPPTTVHTLSVIAVLSSPFVGVEWTFLVDVAVNLIPDQERRDVENDLDSLLDDQVLAKVKSHSVSAGLPALAFVNPAMRDLINSVTLPNLARNIREYTLEQWSSHSDATSPLSHLALAHAHLHLGNRASAELSIKTGYDLLDPEDDNYDLLEVVDMLTAMAAQFNVSLPKIIPGFEQVETEMLWTSSVAQMPKPIVELQTYLAPMSLGYMTVALKRTATFLRNQAINVGTGKTMRSTKSGAFKEVLAEARQRTEILEAYDHQVELMRSLDRVIGFQSSYPTAEAERDHMRKFVAEYAHLSGSPLTQKESDPFLDGGRSCGKADNPSPMDHAAHCATMFMQYAMTTVVERADALEDFCLQHLQIPPTPPSPFYCGAARKAMSQALEKCVEKWPSCETTAVRDSLLVLATEGWLPVNPDNNVEYQCNCYLRYRTHPCVTLLAYLFCNLLYPAHNNTTSEGLLSGGAIPKGLEQLDLTIQTKVEVDDDADDALISYGNTTESTEIVPGTPTLPFSQAERQAVFKMDTAVANLINETRRGSEEGDEETRRREAKQVKKSIREEMELAQSQTSPLSDGSRTEPQSPVSRRRRLTALVVGTKQTAKSSLSPPPVAALLTEDARPLCILPQRRKESHGSSSGTSSQQMNSVSSVPGTFY